MVSKTSIQAINALLELAKLPSAEVEGVVKIAQRIKVPHDYLAKVLQGLVRKGIVNSKKGLKGGFSLSKKQSEIRLYDIVGHVEDLSRLEGCFLGRSICSSENACVAHQRWEIVRKVYKDFLLNTTLVDLKK